LAEAHFWTDFPDLQALVFLAGKVYPKKED